MNRRIEAQTRAEYALPSSTMVDASIAPTGYRVTGRSVVPEEVLGRANVRLEYDQFAGWPPKLAQDTHQQYLAPSSPGISFDLRAQQDYRNAALKHPDVLSHLVGRWETLGVHLVSHRDTPSHVDIRARACFYNYTANQLIEAYIEDGRVSSVRLGEPHEHPEAPVEMAQAIALARAHSQIKDQVAGLTAHAILRVSMDPSALNYKHRCLLVMFTEQEEDVDRELPVLFSTLVDLCEQRVLAFCHSPCGSAVEHDSDVSY